MSTPIPILTAATVTVITSSGIPIKPIVPITAPAERKFGIKPSKAKLKDLNNTKNIINIETKTISYSSYLGEMYKYSSFISPFGWGEICFRDFESIILGKMLIKPNCDHIITWPNIYQDDMYVPIDWEASNLDYALNGLSKEKRLEIVTSEKDYLRLDKSKKKNIKFIKVDLKISNQKKFESFLNKNL